MCATTDDPQDNDSDPRPELPARPKGFEPSTDRTMFLLRPKDTARRFTPPNLSWPRVGRPNIEFPRIDLARITRLCAWALLGLLALAAAALKLAEGPLNTRLDGLVQEALAARDMTIRKDASTLSLLPGLRYTLEGVVLDGAPVGTLRFDTLELSASLVSLALRRPDVHFTVTMGEGRLDGEAAFRAGPEEFTAALRLRALRLEDSRLLDWLLGGRFKGRASGTIELRGAVGRPETISGRIELQAQELLLQDRTIHGVALPPLAISEAEARLGLHDGIAELESVRLGNLDNESEGLRGTLDGSVRLASPLESSELTIGSRFQLSRTFLQSHPEIGAALAPGRHPDGTFAYFIAGTLQAPAAQPSPAEGTVPVVPPGPAGP